MLNCYQKSKQIQKLTNLIVIYNKYTICYLLALILLLHMKLYEMLLKLTSMIKYRLNIFYRIS